MAVRPRPFSKQGRLNDRGRALVTRYLPAAHAAAALVRSLPGNRYRDELDSAATVALAELVATARSEYDVRMRVSLHCERACRDEDDLEECGSALTEPERLPDVRTAANGEAVRALDRMPPAEAEALRRCVVDGRSINEYARESGRHYKASQRLVASGLVRLRKILAAS